MIEPFPGKDYAIKGIRGGKARFVGKERINEHSFYGLHKRKAATRYQFLNLETNHYFTLKSRVRILGELKETPLAQEVPNAGA